MKSYPYTVNDEVDEVQGFRALHGWLPQNSETVSVENARYTIVAPKDYQVRFKGFNAMTAPLESAEGTNKIYTWEIKGIPAQKEEEFVSSWNSLSPMLWTAPSTFEAEGYKGDMSTWKSFGQFQFELLKGRDVLPQETRQQVHRMTYTIKETRRKVAVLYEFLQQNTRYVSIQLGIGGWQPFDANFVATKKYGDCKALSNFMIALLKEAGIVGKYVLIKSGRNPPNFLTDFSVSQFDHVICCVPQTKDSIWLECTSEALPAGYLSSFTSDRYGLMVDESGGTLVRTPKYGIKDNLQIKDYWFYFR